MELAGRLVADRVRVTACDECVGETNLGEALRPICGVGGLVTGPPDVGPGQRQILFGDGAVEPELTSLGVAGLDAERAHAERLRDRHLGFCLKLAEESEPHLWGPDQITWLNRLEIEHDNLRAALDWSRTADGNAELGLRLAGSLAAFWLYRCHFDEGR